MYDGVGPELTADPVNAVVQGMALIARRWRARLNERLKVIDQTDARFAALVEISAEPNGLVQRELSRRLGVEEPTIVRLVDALEAQGWVERLVHGDDRRAKIVRATPAAAPALFEAHIIAAGMRCELFADMDPLDLLACTRVIGELSQRLEVS